MQTTPTTEPASTADRLRAALKAAGYSRKFVSVRHDHYSMGSTLYITIRVANVSRAIVEEICRPFSHVRHDEMTGEVLGGGNTFMEVDYARGVLEVLAQPTAELLAATAPSVAVEIDGAQYVKLDGFVREIDAIGGVHAWCGEGETAEACMFAAKQITERRLAAVQS